MAGALDPRALAARQHALDKQQVRLYPKVLAEKKARMLASPHAFFRGSAPLYYDILKARGVPAWLKGPRGWIVGDMHVENIGAFATDDDRVIFDLNDFDEACVAPWAYDVLRLLASVILSGRAVASTSAEMIAHAELALAQYERSAFSGTRGPPEPAVVRSLRDNASEQQHKKYLDQRCPRVHGKRRFVRGDHYIDLATSVAARVPALVKQYFTALSERAPKHWREWSIDDCAQRLAGNGSLGRLRIAVVMDDHVFDLKQSLAASVPGALVDKDFAARVVAGARALPLAPPRQLTALPPQTPSLFGRRLTPQEDKLALDAVPDKALAEVIAFIAHTLAVGHRRGVKGKSTRWSAAFSERMLDEAITLAGLFEAISLHYAALA